MADIVFGVKRLQPLVFGEVDPPFDPDQVASFSRGVIPEGDL